MVKVGVYNRLSDEDRGKANKTDDSESIANQRSMLIKYAIEHGWDVVDVYSDDDYSGAGVFRPEFDRMIKDCEQGKLDIVLCKTQSRFSRDIEVIEKYLYNKFIEWNVRFISILDHVDTSNILNKKASQISGLVDGWYLEDLSINVRKSLKNKREDGLCVASFAPYGYKKDPNDKHKLIIDDEAANIVREIFEMYKNGLGYHKICKSLNDRKIPSPSEYKKQNGSKFVCNKTTKIWTIDTISQILRRETYIGNLVQGKRTTPNYKNHTIVKIPEDKWTRAYNTHDAIIDKDTWNIVSRRLKTHHKPNKDGNIHILSGKVYCKECERIFMKNQSNVKGPNGSKIKKAYLQCKGSKKYHVCDNNHSISYEELENFILDAINKLLDKCNNFLLKEEYEKEVSKKDKFNNIVASLNKEKIVIEKRLNESREYLKSMYTDKLKGLITEEEFIYLRSEYTKELEGYENRLEEIKNKEKELTNKKESNINIENILKKYKHIDELSKIIVDEFIEKIYIGTLNKKNNTRDIEIEWNLDI